MTFLDNVGDPSYFSAPLPDCLCRVSFIRYSPLSVKVVKKPNKCNSVLVPIFPDRTTLTVLQQIVSEIYHPPFGKVWLSSEEVDGAAVGARLQLVAAYIAVGM